ncbi:MarR family transcriptional regulator [Mycobacterium kansasii]|uniref:Multiple antibiotic resistance protein MarR n=1 Tax=Mycobacterium attenuatum TaxID=2341086 RepID=A0A498QD42_9MYCO|nr:MarR family transcriptional regulator [Mycobacterium attenuatum]ORB87425.1 MarR family transcriptional regulator [Mycobacterium kansasii]VBA42694.1 Multiple antibiotic resistance protein MarR [Mycobacterium attenuatum]VBA58807.1 Multiple antibiotic resistance protein MarR [Mycobacterium attenuatum]VBA61474.1 Multiple antibiotic resistance protein MarR [Mycobacterium attenuatum]
MTKRVAANRQPSRAELERLLSADLRAITAHSDRVGRYYARQNDLSHGDFHALLHLMVAETAGTPLTPAQLSQRLDVSAAAITYLADRMIDAGHIRREPDAEDRRKSLLRLQDGSMALAHEFFRPLGEHVRASLAALPDRDLRSAHKVLTAMVAAMSAFESQLYAPAAESSAPAEKSSTAAPGRRRSTPSKPTKAKVDPATGSGARRRSAAR